MPTSITSQPTLRRPLIKASFSISPLTLVSLPTTTSGFFLPSLLSRVPKAIPIFIANSGVIFSLAIPLTPKVPKSFPMLSPPVIVLKPYYVVFSKVFAYLGFYNFENHFSWVFESVRNSGWYEGAFSWP
ncbi:128aa long hypothetical protein [Pyrococcus horikoshii OT3]|uniref:Uncharacterized protein n=1 Tax=Pyrococcus horikoshii (strain ATCC 700860 / DSM 12428 / JCM 9974 / NBRC 100139 / OT-3) TaxID=70601 RepID=O58650_PYRHO|nr:128aa long hypothetical protein [Pyrococcus horikoshii OT3]